MAFLRRILPPTNTSQPSTPSSRGAPGQSPKVSLMGGKGDTSIPKSLTKGVATKTTSSLQPLLKDTSSVDLEYDIIEDMKKMQANISLYELCKLTNQCELIVKTFVASPAISKPSSSVRANSSGRSKAVIGLQVIVNSANTNSRGSTPPFLLTFEIFNYNVHNCLVDSGV